MDNKIIYWTRKVKRFIDGKQTYIIRTFIWHDVNNLPVVTPSIHKECTLSKTVENIGILLSMGDR